MKTAKCVMIWSQNTWHFYTTVKHAGSLVSKVLHRVFEFKEEIAILLSDSSNNDEANLCYNENFIQKLAYLVDIFEKLSNVKK
jgi:hypothetical protein